MRKVIFTLVILLVSFLNVYSQLQFQWAKRLGASGDDFVVASVVDPAGNVYTTGTFVGTVDFNPGAGTFDLNSVGASDIFISKLDANGGFLWAKSLGGLDEDNVASITLDEQENIYITGSFFQEIDFDPGEGIFNLNTNTSTDTYILKLNSNGEFAWVKQIVSSESCWGNSITIDGVGNIYATGNFFGTVDFDPGEGIVDLNPGGGSNMFILKLDVNGQFVWVKNIGGNSETDIYPYSIKVDGMSNIYTTGYFNSMLDFNPDMNTEFNLTPTGQYDAFVLKLGSDGNFAYAKAIGGSLYDEAVSIAIDNFNKIYIIGNYSETVDFDPGANVFNISSMGETDAFILKLDSDGSFIWAKNMGGSGEDLFYSIEMDESNNIYTTGSFTGTADFNPTELTYNLGSQGLKDIFIWTLNESGEVLWARSMGGAGDDYGISISLDASNNIYTSGHFMQIVDFDPNPDLGIYNLTSAGAYDVFIHKISQCDPALIFASNINGVTLTASEGDSYQWIDCGNNNTPIPGATNQSFIPNSAGSYAVTVTNGNCIVNSFCVYIGIIGLEENWLSDVHIFPNPTKDILNIEVSNDQDTKIELVNSLGQILIQQNLVNKHTEINTKNFTNGVYFLKIFNDKKLVQTRKIMIQ